MTIELNGTGNVTCNLVTGGQLIINTAGTHTLVTDSYWNNFTLTLGTIVGTSYIMKVNGNVLYTAGTATNLIIQFTGDGNLSWDTNTGILKELIVDGTKTCTLTGRGKIKKVSGAGDITGALALYFREAVDDFWGLTGTNSAPFGYLDDTDTPRTSGLAITCGFMNWYQGVVTLDADVTGNSNGELGNSFATMTLDLNGFDLNIGSSFLIKSGATGTLSVDLNGGTIDGAGNVDLTGITITDTATGGVIECAGNFTIDSVIPGTVSVVLNGAGTITTVSGNLALLTINHAGTSTFSNKGYWGSYTVTAGAVDYGNFDLDIAGNFFGTGGIGIQSNQGIWTITATANASKWTSIINNELIQHLVVNAAVTIVPDQGIFLRKLGGSGLITGQPGVVVIFETPSANFWDAESLTLNIDVHLRGDSVASPGSAMTIALGDLIVREQTGWTAAGDITLSSGDLILGSTLAAAGLDMNGHNLLCTNITIGDDENCTLTLGEGTHTIGGDIKPASAATGTLTIAMETCTINLTGTFDAQAIGGGSALTVTGEALGSGHAEIHGGTMLNVLMPLDDATLDATDDVANGGGCTNVWWSGTPGIHVPLGSGMIGAGKAA